MYDHARMPTTQTQSSVVFVSRRKIKKQFLAVLFEQYFHILHERFGLNAKIQYKSMIFLCCLWTKSVLSQKKGQIFAKFKFFNQNIHSEPFGKHSALVFRTALSSIGGKSLKKKNTNKKTLRKKLRFLLTLGGIYLLLGRPVEK